MKILSTMNQSFKTLLSTANKEWKLVNEKLKDRLSAFDNKERELISETSKEKLSTAGDWLWTISSNPFIVSGGALLFEWWRSNKVDKLTDELAESISENRNLRNHNGGLTESRNKLQDDYRVKSEECEYYKDTSAGFETSYHGMSWFSWEKAPVAQRSKFNPEEKNIVRDIAAKNRLEAKVLKQEEELRDTGKELKALEKRLEISEGGWSSYFFGNSPVVGREKPGKKDQDVNGNSVKVK
jgi:hypothetical protein